MKPTKAWSWWPGPGESWPYETVSHDEPGSSLSTKRLPRRWTSELDLTPRLLKPLPAQAGAQEELGEGPDYHHFLPSSPHASACQKPFMAQPRLETNHAVDPPTAKFHQPASDLQNPNPEVRIRKRSKVNRRQSQLASHCGSLLWRTLAWSHIVGKAQVCSMLLHSMCSAR